MIRLDVRADVRAAQRYLSELKANAIRKAAARALNDAATTARADGARRIQQQHPVLKIGDIKNNIAHRRATQWKLVATLETKGRPLSILLFKPGGGYSSRRAFGPRGQVVLRRASKPITARMGKRRSIVQYRGRKAFTVLMYGNEVFVRTEAKGRRIRRFRGPSLPGIFRARSEEMQQLAMARWRVTFPNRLKYEIELAKAKARR